MMRPRCSLPVATLLLAALGMACGPPEPGVPDNRRPPEPAEARLDAHMADAKDFNAYSEQLIAAWLQEDPNWGRTVGLHEHDGKVADYRKSAIDERITKLKAAQSRLAEFAKTKLPDDATLDLAILRNKVALDLFNLTERKLHQTSPTFYQELFSVSSYLDFDYAPFEQRAHKLLEHEEAALAQVDNVLANLQPTLSKPVVETAIKIYAGFGEYLRGDVKKLMANAGDSAFKKRFTATNEKLAKRADEIAAKLKSEVLPKSDMKTHVLGTERYKRFVAAQEGREIDLVEFKRMAEADLKLNKTAYEKLLETVKITRPKATELLSAATKLVEESRAFVVDKKLMTIPEGKAATLKETPPYMRWNAAFLNMPGPFDSAKEAFYYITLPDPKWPKKEQEEYIFPWGTLMATTVHEVYPGHFLHGLWIRKAPTKVQKMIDSYSFTEGWAHYTEQLMVEQGFGKDNPQNHLGQLSDALLRNCRFVASIGIHTEGMTLEEAAKIFRDDCFQDKQTAMRQAVRGTFDPGFFAYTVGKLQIIQLRGEVQRSLGDDFNLQRFHDALLSHGAPPVALIADRVKRDLGAR